MNSCIQGSRIPVALPTELYVSLVDHLSKSKSDCHEPSAAVAAILRSYLDGARSDPPRGGDAALAPGRSTESITLGSLPEPTKEQALKPSQQSTSPRRNDWCIGCGCPAEDLIA